MFEELKEYWDKNNEIINNLITRLKYDNYGIDLKDFKHIAKLSKLDVAEELVKKSRANTTKEAYHKIINRYPKYNIEEPNIKDVIQMIHRCQGIVVLPHPYEIFSYGEATQLNKEQVENFVESYLNYWSKIDAIEVYGNCYTKEQELFLEDMAEKYKLYKSVGNKNKDVNIFYPRKDITILDRLQF